MSPIKLELRGKEMYFVTSTKKFRDTHRARLNLESDSERSGQWRRAYLASAPTQYQTQEKALYFHLNSVFPVSNLHSLTIYLPCASKMAGK